MIACGRLRERGDTKPCFRILVCVMLAPFSVVKHGRRDWLEMGRDGTRTYFVHVGLEVPCKGKYLAKFGFLGLTLRRGLGKELRHGNFWFMVSEAMGMTISST